MSKGEFNPNSIDAKLAEICAKLDAQAVRTEDQTGHMQRMEREQRRIADVFDARSAKLEKRIERVEGKIVRFRYWIAGCAAGAGILAGVAWDAIKEWVKGAQG